MSEVPPTLYEGMFLLNQQAVASDFADCLSFMKEIFERAEAELVVMRKWDERKLAYPIAGQKRGFYILAYFRAQGDAIVGIERDCNLSEQVLRCMILRADHMGQTELDLAAKDADLSLETQLREAGGDNESEAEVKVAAVAEADPVDDPATSGKEPETEKSD